MILMNQFIAKYFLAYIKSLGQMATVYIVHLTEEKTNLFFLA